MLSMTSQMWYANRLPVSIARESLQYSTWEQLLLYQSDTVIYEVSNPFAFEEFWPSHLSFVFISVVLVTHCPQKPWNGSVDLVANEWRVVSPFLRRETKLWMRNQERMGEWVTVLCPCSTYFAPQAARTVLIVQREKEASFRDFQFGWSQKENAETMLLFSNDFTFQVKIFKNKFTYAKLHFFKKLELSLECQFQGLFMVFG